MSRRPRNAIPADDYAVFLQRLRQKGYRRARLATRLGLSPTALRYIECGTTRWIYPETAALIASLASLEGPQT